MYSLAPRRPTWRLLPIVPLLALLATLPGAGDVSDGILVADVQETEVVTPDAMGNWAEEGDPVTGTTNWVTGPSTPPAGTGSVQFVISSAPAPRALVNDTDYAGVALDDVRSLAYQTFVANDAGITGLAPTLRLEVTYPGDGTVPATPGQLIFRPQAGLGMWEDWDTLNGAGWISPTPIPNVAPGDCSAVAPCTWSTFASTNPSTTIDEVRLEVGNPAADPVWAAFDGNIDALVVGVDDGTDVTTTTHDFEPGAGGGPTVPDETVFAITGGNRLMRFHAGDAAAGVLVHPDPLTVSGDVMTLDADGTDGVLVGVTSTSRVIEIDPRDASVISDRPIRVAEPAGTDTVAGLLLGQVRGATLEGPSTLRVMTDVLDDVAGTGEETPLSEHVVLDLSGADAVTAAPLGPVAYHPLDLAHEPTLTVGALASQANVTYVIDTGPADDILATLGDGTVPSLAGQLFTVGTLGVDAAEAGLSGFDADEDDALLSFSDGVTSTLAAVDLGTGATTPAGPIQLSGSDAIVRDLTIATWDVIDFGSTQYSVDEGETVDVTVVRSSPDGAASVDVHHHGGTAGSGDHDFAGPVTVSFAAGETSRTVSITAVDDTEAGEGDETLELELRNPSPGNIVEEDETTVTIHDTDVAGTIRFASISGSASEGDTDAGPVVERTGGTTGQVTVDYEVTGGSAEQDRDWSGRSTGTLTLDHGVTSAPIPLDVNTDGRDEFTETVAFELTGTGGGATLGDPTTTTLDIIDRDPLAQLSIDDVTIKEGDASSPSGTTAQAKKMVFTVRLAPPSGKPVEVDIATRSGTARPGADFVGKSGTLAFAPGQGSQTFAVQIEGDDAFESDEKFSVKLSRPVNARVSDGRATGTILDDDPQPKPADPDEEDDGRGKNEPDVKGDVVERASPPAGAVTPTDKGYWIFSPVGTVDAFGDAEPMVGISGILSAGTDASRVIVDLASTQTGDGVWLTDRSGGIYGLGDAPFFGSMHGLRDAGLVSGLPEVAGLAAAPGGDGYALLTLDGGVFTLGSAQFHGSMHTLLAEGTISSLPEVVDIVYMPDGDGYVIVDRFGSVYAFGSAVYRGSVAELKALGALPADIEIVDFALAPDGEGYVLVDSRGGTYAFGSARFLGSMHALLEAGVVDDLPTIVSVELTSDGMGMWLFDEQGRTYTFGNALYLGGRD